MFFLFSKILDFFLQPVIWILLISGLSLFLKNGKARKRLQLTALLVLLFLTNPFFCNLVINFWERPPVEIKQLPVYDAGIVLTGITAEMEFPNDRVYLKRGADRILHALQLYREGKIRKIIISGGSGSLSKTERTEAEKLRVILRHAQVPDSVIMLEERSRNTRENALFTKDLLAKYPEIKNILLITSAFHVRRAEGCFNQVGLKPAIFPTDFYGLYGERSFDDILMPHEQNLSDWAKIIREISGYGIYKVLGYC